MSARKGELVAAILQGIALALLAGTAHAAAAATFGSGFKDLPASAWVLTLVLSTLSGMVALLNRIREELRQNGALRWGALFVSAHMLGSWLAGLLVFLVSISLAWSEAATAIAIIAASFGGAVFIEKMAIKWLWRSFGVNVSAPAPLLDRPMDRTFPPTQMLNTPPERRRQKPRKSPPPAPPQPDFAAASDSAPLDDG